MSDLKKILIIRFSSLGDVILASPLIRTLRAAYPNAQIDFLVKSQYADVLRFNPHLNSVITLKSSDRKELFFLKKMIRHTGYDLIIDIHNSLRSRWIRWGAGAVQVKVVRKRIFKRLLYVLFGLNFYGNATSVAERYIETVRKFGVRDDGSGLEIFVPDETKSTVNAIIGKFKPDQFEIIFGFGPAARHYTKRWLPERFVELGVELSKHYRCKIFIFGGKEDTDYCSDIAQMINAHAGYSCAENFAGKLTLIETSAALDFCSLIVSNDTALMHLAAARRKKIVAIFGSSVKEFGFSPFRTSSIVLERNDVRCRPCSHIGRDRCPKKHFRCMKEIQVKDVVNAVEELLQK